MRRLVLAAAALAVTATPVIGVIAAAAQPAGALADNGVISTNGTGRVLADNGVINSDVVPAANDVIEADVAPADGGVISTDVVPADDGVVNSRD